MSAVRGNFGELLLPGLATVYFNEFDRWKPEYPNICKIQSSAKNKEEDLLITSLGIMDAKQESAPVTYDDIFQGFKTTYTHTTFAKAIRISMEMYEDDLYSVMRDMTTALARAAQQRMEVDAANVLNNAFTAGASAGADGVALISAVHPLSMGGTQSNALAAVADLTAASLQEAIGIVETTQDERGLNCALQAKLLVVPPQNQWAAYELVKSEFKPGTADNEVNAIMGKGISATVNHYLTDPDSWFVLSDQHKIKWFQRLKPEFFKGTDFDSDDCKFKGRMRHSVGFSDFRGVTGNQGA